METTWLQEEKLRAFPSAPVSREIFFDQMARNKVADLLENGEFAAGWFSFF